MSFDDSIYSHRMKKLDIINRKNKAPSFSGYDKRNPLQKSLLKLTTKNLSPLLLDKLNPFYMEELGGNMLNVNRTFQKNEFTNPESNDHIERFLLESSQFGNALDISTKSKYMDGENIKENNSKFEKFENFEKKNPNFSEKSGEVYDVNCPDSVDTMDDEDEAIERSVISQNGKKSGKNSPKSSKTSPNSSFFSQKLKKSPKLENLIEGGISHDILNDNDNEHSNNGNNNNYHDNNDDNSNNNNNNDTNNNNNNDSNENNNHSNIIKIEDSYDNGDGNGDNDNNDNNGRSNSEINGLDTSSFISPSSPPKPVGVNEIYPGVHDTLELDDISILRFKLNRVEYELNLEKRKGRPLKVVVGSQFRLPLGPTMTCDFCFKTDMNAKVSKDNCRTLKLQLSRLNEEISIFRKAKELDIATNLTQIRDDLLDNQNDLQRKIDYMELESLKLKKKIHTDEIQLDFYKNQVIQLQLQTKSQNLKEKERCESNETSTLKLTLESLVLERDDLLTAVEELKKGLTGFKTQLDHSETKRRAVRRKSMEKLAEDKDGKEDTAKLKTDLFSKTVELEAQAIKIKKMTSEVTTLATLASELQESNRKIIDTREKLKQEQRQLVKNLEFEKKKVEEINVKYLESQSSVPALTDLLIRKTTQYDTLKIDNETLKKQFNEDAERYQAEYAIQMQALESAIASSVRLCVVAPTVNVHVTDDKFKLQSGLPESSIKDFIVHEVLSNYTFLFKQMEENSGPDGSSLQDWIENMLFTLQDSIEQHVQAAMHDST